MSCDDESTFIIIISFQEEDEEEEEEDENEDEKSGDEVDAKKAFHVFFLRMAIHVTNIHILRVCFNIAIIIPSCVSISHVLVHSSVTYEAPLILANVPIPVLHIPLPKTMTGLRCYKTGVGGNWKQNITTIQMKRLSNKVASCRYSV